MLEHVVTTNIVSHMDKYNLLYALQHGFRSKRSCETQLVTLIEDLMRNSIASNQTDLVLLDFSKAFDKVSHQELLLKLHRYGIRGPTLKWIQAFLSDRTQTVVTRDVFYVRREVDLMKTAKVNAYIMHIFGKIELLSIHAT